MSGENRTDTAIDLADERIGKWRSALEQELQELITTAATIRKNINTAKTSVKKTYYSKKFKKISDQVMQMVAALQRLDAHKKEIEAEKEGAHDQLAAA